MFSTGIPILLLLGCDKIMFKIMFWGRGKILKNIFFLLGLQKILLLG